MTSSLRGGVPAGKQAVQGLATTRKHPKDLQLAEKTLLDQSARRLNATPKRQTARHEDNRYQTPPTNRHGRLLQDDMNSSGRRILRNVKSNLSPKCLPGDSPGLIRGSMNRLGRAQSHDGWALNSGIENQIPNARSRLKRPSLKMMLPAILRGNDANAQSKGVLRGREADDSEK